MDETELFFTKMGEDFERAYRHAPPQVSFDGWWWKRFIPYFQRMRKICQRIVDENWIQRPEEVEMIIKQIEKEERKSFLKNYTP